MKKREEELLNDLREMFICEDTTFTVSEVINVADKYYQEKTNEPSRIIAESFNINDDSIEGFLTDGDFEDGLLADIADNYDYVNLQEGQEFIEDEDSEYKCDSILKIQFGDKNVYMPVIEVYDECNDVDEYYALFDLKSDSIDDFIKTI